MIEAADQLREDPLTAAVPALDATSLSYVASSRRPDMSSVSVGFNDGAALVAGSETVTVYVTFAPGAIAAPAAGTDVFTTWYGAGTTIPAGSLGVRVGPVGGVTVADAVFTVVPTAAAAVQVFDADAPAARAAMVKSQPGTRESVTGIFVSVPVPLLVTVILYGTVSPTAYC
jgi:hypothetical protein